jgi:MSHA pilin protein MshD
MCNKSESGLTLIELLVFIVIVGISASAMLAVFGSLTRSSASLLPDKQAQAIAASMMSEILAQPYTFCDPNDANAATATSAAGCASLPEALGPEPGETRTTFDNVNDYNGLVLNPVSNPGNMAVPGLPGYGVQVTVAGAGAFPGVPAAETLRVTVSVTAPNGAVARLDGVRMRYAPAT